MTKGEITEFLSSLDVVTFPDRCLNASHHHGANTDSHHATELRTIDGNDPSNILSVDEQCGLLAAKDRMMSKTEKNEREADDLH
jgi:hypothetical protein